MLLQRASAFSSSVVVANLAAFSEQVKAEGSQNKEPQPSVISSLNRCIEALKEKVEVK